jgi:hypothetical protein
MLKITPMARKPRVKLPRFSVVSNTVFSTSMKCGTPSWVVSLIQSPSFSWASQMATCVNGLLTQHAAIEMGIFTRARMLARAANTIWKGIGSIAQKSPMDRAPATV